MKSHRRLFVAVSALALTTAAGLPAMVPTQVPSALATSAQVASPPASAWRSPGLTPRLLDAAPHAPMPLLPGVATASELMSAMDAGFSRFKFFPAQQAGGMPMLKAFGGPFPEAVFCPTGGISPDNAPDYLALPNVACVGGSWLAPAEAVREGDWDRITQLAQAAAALLPR